MSSEHMNHLPVKANVKIQVGTDDVDDSNPVPISDAGGSITVDGPLTDTQLQAATVSVYSSDDVYEATLSLDTNAYASGDVLAGTQLLEANAFPANGGKLVINKISLLDKDDQGGAMDIVLLRSNTSLGTENAAVSITDTNAEEILLIAKIQSTDWIDIGDAKWAEVEINRIIKAASDTALYIGAISRDTKTHTASGIKVRVGVFGRSA